jgi:hypothetical protein
MASTTLSSILRSSVISKYSNTDAGWIQFVKDYKNLFIKNSKIYTLTYDIMATYQYRLKDYMKYVGISLDLEYVIREINDLHGDEQFKDIKFMYVPTIEYLRTVFNLYKTSLVKTTL